MPIFSLPSLRQRLTFYFTTTINRIGFNLNFFRSTRHHDAVIEQEVKPDGNLLGNIYVGALPLYRAFGRQTKDQKTIYEKCKDATRPLSKVFACVQEFELNKNFFFKPVVKPTSKQKSSEWPADVTVHQINMPDFTLKVEFHDLYKAIFQIEEARQRGESVFIHCKAGKSRSILLLMCYLTTVYRDPRSQMPLTFSQAYQLIKNKRPQISFHAPRKKIMVENFFRYYHDQQKKTKTPVYSTEPINIKRASSSLEFEIPNNPENLVKEEVAKRFLNRSR